MTGMPWESVVSGLKSNAKVGPFGGYFSSPYGNQSIALPAACTLPSASAGTSLVSILSGQARKVEGGGRGEGGKGVGN